MAPPFGLVLMISVVLLFALIGIWFGLLTEWPDPTEAQKKLLDAVEWFYKGLVGGLGGLGLGRIAK